MCMNHLSFFCGYPSYAFDFESFPYSVSILDFFYLKVNTLYTFVFVNLTGNNEIWQTLPQNKKCTMLLQVKKVLVTISKLYDLLKSLKLLWSVTKTVRSHLHGIFTFHKVNLSVSCLGDFVRFINSFISLRKGKIGEQQQDKNNQWCSKFFSGIWVNFLLRQMQIHLHFT